MSTIWRHMEQERKRRASEEVRDARATVSEADKVDSVVMSAPEFGKECLFRQDRSV